jgi:DNA invertase Pin-like site-specific DNA recombinase
VAGIIEAQINTRTAIGRVFFQLLAVFAELERAQIAERTSQAMLYHQANGRRGAGRIVAPTAGSPIPPTRLP